MLCKNRTNKFSTELNLNFHVVNHNRKLSARRNLSFRAEENTWKRIKINAVYRNELEFLFGAETERARWTKLEGLVWNVFLTDRCQKDPLARAIVAKGFYSEILL